MSGVATEEVVIDLPREKEITPEMLQKARDEALAENRALCQNYIKNECKRGDTVVIFPRGSDPGQGTSIGEIVDTSIATVDIYDRLNGRATDNVCYYLDERMKNPDFAKNHDSFDHPEETKLVRKMSKKGADSASSVIGSFAGEIKELEEKIEAGQLEVKAELAEFKSMILDVIKKVNDLTKIKPIAKPVKGK